MTKLVPIVPIVLFITAVSNAQTASKDVATPAGAATESKFKAFRSFVATKAIYPLIKSSKYSGVVPVSQIDEKPDANMQYKLLVDVSTGFKDISGAGEINDAIAEVARAINTHIAAGVPKKHIDMVVVAHGATLKAFYTNNLYKEKYGVDNPNTVLFNELLALGVKFTACGQSMAFQNITKDQLVPWLKVALSAQIPISTYQLKGYVYKKIETD